MLHYWKSGFVNVLSEEAIEAVVDYFASEIPAPFAAIAIEHLGGAIASVGPQNTAFSHIIGRTLDGPTIVGLPSPVRMVDRFPLLRRIPGRLLGFRIRRKRVESSERSPCRN